MNSAKKSSEGKGKQQQVKDGIGPHIFSISLIIVKICAEAERN
jgi:hypothetical protein